jgi:hypothetical protein
MKKPYYWRYDTMLIARKDVFFSNFFERKNKMGLTNVKNVLYLGVSDSIYFNFKGWVKQPLVVSFPKE